MEETAMIEKLISFGLTRQEATIYLCLFSVGELTGYEASKQTGISRSNVYSALAELVEKGAAYVVEGAASKYIPVSLEEFCENKIAQLKRDEEYLLKHIPKGKESTEGYITIEGSRHIEDKVFHMIRNAESRLYLSASGRILDSLMIPLVESINRGIKVVVITNEDKKQLSAKVYLSEKYDDQIRLIVDSAYVLTGQFSGGDDDTCLFSGQENFVNVFKEALGNEIKLIELEKKGNKIL